MPKLIDVNERYKDKGLVMILIAYESRDKMKSYAKSNNITLPIAIEPTKTVNKAYGIRGYPSSFVVAPDGKVVWKGHPASEELEAAIKAELPNVKKGGGGAGAGLGKDPTKLELKEDVAARLKSAVQKAARGDLGGALRLAEKVLADGKASADKKKDARYVKGELEKRAAELFAEVERLLGEKMPYEARQLLIEVRKAFKHTDNAEKAQKKIKAIEEDEELADGLKAGRIFAKGLEQEEKGKSRKARRYFKQVVDKYPRTEYAKRSRAKLKQEDKRGR